MASPVVTRDGDVFVIALTDNENRFNRTSVDAIHACLDEIDAADGPKAMVVTGEGKFFSNGLDLDWLATKEEDMFGFIADVTRMWARILEAPYPTVAAINGHAFAGGAIATTDENASGSAYLETATQSLAREHARDGIRINMILAGHVAVDRRGKPEHSKVSPLGRVSVHPVEVGKAAWFLANHDLNPAMTGESLKIDRGASLLRPEW